MRYWLLRPLRHVLEALRESATPGQLALGATLGMLVGLVPKDNLVAVLLAVLVLAVRNNLAAAAFSAMVFSWLSVLTDPLAHAMGHFVLTLRFLQPLFAFLYDLPLVPWTRLNNTVVAGSLMLGAILSYPCYRLVKYAVERYGPALAERLKQYPVWQILRGAKLAAGVKLK